MKSYSCQICGRQLTDTESITKGFGPDCAAKRAGFIASYSTTDTEIATLEAAGEQAAKWVRNFRTDMRHGRIRQARQCIEFARYKAGQEAPAPVVAAALVEAPALAIVVRQIERGGYYAYTPFNLVGFTDAFKRVVGGTWNPEKEAWYVPTDGISWTIEALEYWFGLKVKVEPYRQAAMYAQPRHHQQQFASAMQ